MRTRALRLPTRLRRLLKVAYLHLNQTNFSVSHPFYLILLLPFLDELCLQAQSTAQRLATTFSFFIRKEHPKSFP